MKKQVLLAGFVLMFLCFGTVSAQKYAVHFKDKNGTPYSVDNPSAFLSKRALDRRDRFQISITETDLPVNPNYVEQVRDFGATVLFSSKWINCVLIDVDNTAIISEIEQIDFVEKVVAVYPFKTTKPKTANENKLVSSSKNSTIPLKNTASIYGGAHNQIEQLNGILVHEKGYKGGGVLIAVLDGGFANVDKISAFQPLFTSGRLVMAKDFVEPGGNIYSDNLSQHGTCVLSCMGAYLPNQMVGTAPEASYCLFRTEDVRSEYLIEEYNWVIGAETADSIGADIVNSSLIYTVYGDTFTSHTYADMDGKTCIASIGARYLTECGVFVCNSAGNSGNDTSWPWIGTPADPAEVLTVGAVNSYGTYASFSSIGPNAANDQKPNTMAQGAGATIINRNGEVETGSGTSYASPITCGMVACMIQACFDKNPQTLKNMIEASCNFYDSPSVTMGYGIPDFYSVLQSSSICESIPTEKLQVYPNPTTGCFTVKTTRTLKKIRLFDLAGRILMEQAFPENAINTVCIDGFNSGMYILCAYPEEGNTISVKIVKAN